MFYYQYAVDLESASIARYPTLIRGWLDRAEWLHAAAGARRLAERFVARGLLRWRAGEEPVGDFLHAAHAVQDSDALIAGRQLSFDRGGADSDLFARVFSMIGAAAHIPVVSDEEMGADEVPQFVAYSRYISLRLHDRVEAEMLRAKVLGFLGDGRRLVDESYRVYLMLLGDLPADGDTDKLVAQAERNWTKRRADRFFQTLSMYEGHGDLNAAYPDATLAAILKRVGWEGESVHRWRWSSPSDAA